jgi:hypothetical protein
MARNERRDPLDTSDMDDDEIRSLVRDELREQPNIDADLIEVDVSDGKVTLSGRVGTDAEVNIAGHLVTDVVGAVTLDNELVVDEGTRGERAAGADEAMMEQEEHDRMGGDVRQQSDTAAHLQENLEEEHWGTHDMQSAIQDGTSYTPPDSPTADGYDSREDH